MSDGNGLIELRLLDGDGSDGQSDGSLNLEATIKVEKFSGCGVFATTGQVIEEFVEQLDSLLTGRLRSAKLECGVVADRTEVVYFSCQIESSDAGGAFIAQVTLGTGGPNGLLQRLHVGVCLIEPSVAALRSNLHAMALDRKGRAILRATLPADSRLE